MKLETVIGLEIHVQLKTASKMFCSCANNGEDMPPNTAICPICLGHPGTLPVTNNLAVELAVMTALALGCRINERSKFDRKNYFYPDLPKGYQISQFDMPIGEHGFFEIELAPSHFISPLLASPELQRGEEGGSVADGATKSPVETFGGDTQERSKRGVERRRIGITRVHLEEDAAKLRHSPDGRDSLVDFNRAGTPLLEIVTEPDLRTPPEAKIFTQELRLLTRALGVSDADMEKGHLRCDANISLRPEGTESFFPKTEVKNINSFRFVERALAYEIERQAHLWETGEQPTAASTRGWNERSGQTEEQRTKEESHDYRYFPEPDIPPLIFTKEWIRSIEVRLPELPIAQRARFVTEYALTPSDVKILTEDAVWTEYTEKVFAELHAWLLAQEGTESSEGALWEQHKKKLGHLVGGWLVNKLAGIIAEQKVSLAHLPLSAEDFAEFMVMVFQNRFSSRMAHDILRIMVETGKDPHVIIEENGIEQVSDREALEEIAQRIITQFPDQAADYRGGKEPILKFFIGQLMKETKGQADPKGAEEVLRRVLSG